MGCDQSAPARASAPKPPGEIFSCTPKSVASGQGPVKCVEGDLVRLAGVSARHEGAPCPGSSGGRVDCDDDRAREGRLHLATLLRGIDPDFNEEPHLYLLDDKGWNRVSGPRLSCVSVGRESATTIAWCRSPATGDLSCDMISSSLVDRRSGEWRNHECEAENAAPGAG